MLPFLTNKHRLFRLLGNMDLNFEITISQIQFMHFGRATPQDLKILRNIFISWRSEPMRLLFFRFAQSETSKIFSTLSSLKSCASKQCNGTTNDFTVGFSRAGGAYCLLLLFDLASRVCRPAFAEIGRLTARVLQSTRFWRVLPWFVSEPGGMNVCIPYLVLISACNCMLKIVSCRRSHVCPFRRFRNRSRRTSSSDRLIKPRSGIDIYVPYV